MRRTIVGAVALLASTAGIAIAPSAGAVDEHAHGPRPFGLSIPAQPSLYYPLAVDAAPDGALWVSDTGHDQVVRIDPHEPGRARRIGSGVVGAALGDFNGPTGVAHDSRGHVFVVDQGNNRVVELNPAGQPLRAFGSPADGAGGLNYPGSIAIDEHDDIYVTDIGDNRVVEYGPDEHAIRAFGTKGSGDGQFLYGLFCLRSFCHADLGTPAGIAVGGGAVYVADSDNGRVEKFTGDGRFVASWSQVPGHTFASPAAVSLDGHGHVVVVEFQSPDTYTERIDVLNTDGSPVSVWGRHGVADDSIAFAQGLTVSAGTVYVADSGHDRIQEFTLTGAHLGQIGTPASVDRYRSLAGIAAAPAGDIVVGRVDTQALERYDATGRRQAAIDVSGARYPLGVGDSLTVDGHGSAYVVHFSSRTVEGFSATGAALGSWGPADFGDHALVDPKRLAIAADGDFYLADAGRFCVERFTPAAQYVSGFGLCSPNQPQGSPPPPPPPGGPPPPVTCWPHCVNPEPRSSNDPVHDPIDLAVDGSGDVYVLDSNEPPPQPPPVVCPPDYPKQCPPPGSPPPWPPPGYGSMVLKFDPAGTLLASWGGFGDGQGQFDNPDALALGPDGTVYVADHYGGRVQAFASSGAFLRSWQPQIRGSSQFSGTFTATAAGQIVSIMGNYDSYGARGPVYPTVVISSGDGTVLRQWDNAGGAVGRFVQPTDALPLGNGDVLVSDFGNTRLVAMTPDGDVVRQVGSTGDGPGQFAEPDELALDGQGGVLVADYALGRIQDLTLDGHARASWGSVGTGDGQFAFFPSGLARASDGTVYAADGYGNRIEHFTANGTFLGWAGRCGGGPNCDVAAGHSRGFSCTAATCTGLDAGNAAGQFQHPQNLTFDNTGRLLVTELDGARVQAISLGTGAFDVWPIPQQGDQPPIPSGIAVDRNDHVYVTDESSSTVLVLDSLGHVVTRWGSPGASETQFDVPIRVHVADDIVYVTDSLNHRVLRFHTYQPSDPPAASDTRGARVQARPHDPTGER